MQDDNQTRQRLWELTENHRYAMTTRGDSDAQRSRTMTTIEHVASGRLPRSIGEHRDVTLGRRS